MFSQANCNRLLLRWFPPYPSASLSAMKAEYIPLPPPHYPPPPHHPIVGQQSQIPWMKQLQWAFLYISLQTQQSGFYASTLFNTPRPHLRPRSFPFPVVASTLPPSFSLYIGFEVQRSRTRSFVFFLEMLLHVKSRK